MAEQRRFNRMRFNLTGAEAGTEIPLLAAFRERVEGACAFRGELVARCAFAERAASRLAAGAQVRMPGMAAKVQAHGRCAARLTITEEALLALTLGPGATLVIDASDYTVAVDGRNNIDHHQGVWPVLDRDVMDIAVEPVEGGAAALSAVIGYRERWL